MNLWNKLSGDAKPPVAKSTMQWEQFVSGYAFMWEHRPKTPQELQSHIEHQVVCAFCNQLVNGIETVTPKGELRCPRCGKFWLDFQG